MKTSYQRYLDEGKIYAASPKDTCLTCLQPIGKEPFATCLKIDPSWDRKEKFNFDRHVLDDLKGYKHQSCRK